MALQNALLQFAIAYSNYLKLIAFCAHTMTDKGFGHMFGALFPWDFDLESKSTYLGPSDTYIVGKYKL